MDSETGGIPKEAIDFDAAKAQANFLARGETNSIQPGSWAFRRKEEKEERERVEGRRPLAENLVEKYFPESSTPEKEKYNLRNLVSTLAFHEIPEDQLEDFLTILFDGAKQLEIPGKSLLDTTAQLATIPESVDKARIYADFARTWREKFLQEGDDTQKYNRRAAFLELTRDLSGRNRSPRPPEISAQSAQQIFDNAVELYKEVYSLPEQTMGSRELVSRSMNAAKETNDPEQILFAAQVLKDSQGIENKEIRDSYLANVGRYARQHPLSVSKLKGIEEKLLPAMLNNDPQVGVLLRGGNIWGMERGDFGVGDLLVHCYASEISPANLNELMLTARQVPATTVSRLEQNRKDALIMAGPFGALRDFIHDQRPGVHEVLASMVEYYDTGKAENLQKLIGQTEGYLADPRRQDAILDRSRYDQLATEASRNDDAEPIPVIDYLRRLEKNTRPVDETPPATADQELNQKLKNVFETKGTEKGREGLGEVMENINQKLLSQMQNHEIGIDPSMVEAISWAEQQGFQVLQKLNYEGQLGAYRQEWFHSLLRFQELTSSARDFDEVEFNSFIERVKNAPTEQEAYRMISQRTLLNIGGLADKYKQQGRESWSGALWSGNINHELTTLVDLRPASTALGRRDREEKLNPEKRLPGD
ncbi:MAG: hypothetical protein Q8P13_01065 [bacterium]|nr:hypothetical protein [bacterium]